MPSLIKVFSPDSTELAPCNIERANSLVRKNKACFVVTNGQRAIVINKTPEQLNAKGGKK